MRSEDSEGVRAGAGATPADDDRTGAAREGESRVVLAPRDRPQDLARVRDYWRGALGTGAWPVEDLYLGLLARFVGRIVAADPAGLARVRGRSCLYLANHQVAVESLLFTLAMPALTGVVTSALAKAEHRASWMGRLLALTFAYPGVADPGLLAFFDRADPAALLRFTADTAAALRAAPRGVLVHVEGTRARACGLPVAQASGALLDLALASGAPIVPVRFLGGLPVEPAAARLDFPVGYGRQDYWLGRPLFPEDLAALPLRDRKDRVVRALNELGPPLADERPAPADPAFARDVARWTERTGARPEYATLLATLAAAAAPHPLVTALLTAVDRGAFDLAPGPASAWLADLARLLLGDRAPEGEL